MSEREVYSPSTVQMIQGSVRLFWQLTRRQIRFNCEDVPTFNIAVCDDSRALESAGEIQAQALPRTQEYLIDARARNKDST